MEKLIQNIKPKDFVKFVSVLLISVVLFFCTVVINNNDSVPGRGFESAKVNVIQVGSTLIIFTTFVFLAYALFTYSSSGDDFKDGLRKLAKSRKSLLFMGLLSLSLIISTQISPFRDIATQGNMFRFQGLSTYLPMILCVYILYKSVDRRNIHLITSSIILSGIFQAFMAFSQIYNLAKNDPSRLTEGIWINGYYGQANFFSSHLLIAIVLASYYLSTKSLRALDHKKQRLAVITLAIAALSVLIPAMILSYSSWGWVSLLLSAVTVLSFELMPKKIFRIFITGLTVTITIAGTILISNFPTYELRLEIWQRIRDIMQYNIKTPDSFKFFVFGYGFDTLSDVFKLFGNFPKLVIDRGHNILFDILIQTGIAGFAFFTIVIGRLIFHFKKMTSNRLLFFVSAAFFLWIFKSIVNEYSIANFFQWIAIGACALKILTIDEDDDLVI